MDMRSHGRALARTTLAALLVMLTACAGAWAAGGTPKDIDQGTSKPKLVRFVRPTEDTLLEKGTGAIRFIVHTRDGARPTHADVDGVDVLGLLRRGPRGDYGALLNFDRHLHYGINDAFVQVKGQDGAVATDHTRFIVARRDDSLLKLTGFRTATAEAPLQVGVRDATDTNVRATLNVAEGVSARAYINGRRVDRAFSQEGKRLVVRLGADDRLHFGRNHIQ